MYCTLCAIGQLIVYCYCLYVFPVVLQTLLTEVLVILSAVSNIGAGPVRLQNKKVFLQEKSLHALKCNTSNKTFSLNTFF